MLFFQERPIRIWPGGWNNWPQHFGGGTTTKNSDHFFEDDEKHRQKLWQREWSAPSVYFPPCLSCNANHILLFYLYQKRQLHFTLLTSLLTSWLFILCVHFSLQSPPYQFNLTFPKIPKMSVWDLKTSYFVRYHTYKLQHKTRARLYVTCDLLHKVTIRLLVLVYKSPPVLLDLKQLQQLYN